MSPQATATAEPRAGRPARTSPYIPAGEAVLFDSRPHPLFIVLRSAGRLALLLGAAVGLHLAAGRLGWPLPGWVVRTLLALALVQLVWNTLEWIARRYVLTEQRVLRIGGVLQRYATDLPLERIQHVTLTRLIRERIFGLGTLGFATAGTGLVEVYWIMIERPHQRLAEVRRILDRARAGPSEGLGEGRPAAGTDSSAEPGRAAHPRPLVIGLAGGIGAGKSEVARLLGEMGGIVVDSDALARAALERPEIKDELVRWWGPRVLREDGSVDRRAVADIVFADPAQRARLEGLVHPILRPKRGRIVQEAAEAGASFVVIDAPLLFEAGVDAECDAVIFVEAPRERRLERVRATRGWDADELERRERMQWPLAEKRRRAAAVVVNDADRETLRARTAAALESLRRGRPAG